VLVNSVECTWLLVLERGGRGGGGGSSRRAAEASTLTPSDDDFDCNETMSVVSNCSDMQTAAQLTDGKCCCSGVLEALLYVLSFFVFSAFLCQFIPVQLIAWKDSFPK